MRTFVPNERAEARLLETLIPSVTVVDVDIRPDHLVLTVAPTTTNAACPHCATISSRVHSYYTRQPTDLPISGQATRLLLHVRRFRCANPACSAKTFAERLPSLIAPAAQRTARLNAALRDLALAFGGEAGARQSARAVMPASADTLLRRAHAACLPSHPTPRILGVDDFAFQKGRVYGTILTDNETHAVIELLPDRAAETVAAWLQTHPGVEIVTRDRSTEYARGVSLGAPDAVQVADRWHILVNLREALERMLGRLRPRLLALPAAAVQTTAPLISTDRDRGRGTLDQARQQTGRAQRYARYADVKRLQADGRAIIQIARELSMSRQTVRKYMASAVFPEYPRPRQQASMLDPYVTLLQAQWDAGCHGNQPLWEAIRTAGYSGSIRAVVQWTRLRRCLLPGYQPPSGRPPAREVEQFAVPAVHAQPHQQERTSGFPGSRQLVWLLLLHTDQLDETEQQQRARMCTLSEVALARDLAQQFRLMVRDRKPEALSPWIQASQASGIGELKTFAEGLQREQAVIQAALEFPYSNGITEGHVHRLKMIKRTAYGRASFKLLRQRVLASL